MSKVSKSRSQSQKRLDQSNRELLEAARVGVRAAVSLPAVQLAIELTRLTLLRCPATDSPEVPIYIQLIRGLNSTAANIVEGYGSPMSQNRIKFLKTARGSAYENVVHALCIGLDYTDTIRNLADEVDRLVEESVNAYEELFHRDVGPSSES